MNTSMEGITLRMAVQEDTGLILGFIRQLAAYEHMSDQVEATEELLRDSLFKRHAAEVLIAEYYGEPAGFALFFHNMSTFRGLPGIYLEDLFVNPAYRGRGIGKSLLVRLAALAVERKCGRVEWTCLDWNTPSIGFYQSLGAKPQEAWTIYRLDGDALDSLAGNNRDSENEKGSH